jgi:hypothetical protein
LLPDAVASWQGSLRAGELLLAAAKDSEGRCDRRVADRIDRALFLSYRENLTARPPSKT